MAKLKTLSLMDTIMGEARILRNELVNPYRSGKRIGIKKEQLVTRLEGEKQRWADAGAEDRMDMVHKKLVPIHNADTIHNAEHLAFQGDEDMIDAYLKFQTSNHWGLHLTVNSLRKATGQYKVAHLLTQEHFDTLRRMYDYKDVLVHLSDRKLNQLSVLLLLNTEHTDAILELVASRKLTNVKDIAEAFEKESVAAEQYALTEH